MSFTREQFYNEAIRPNLAHFSTNIKVREIIPHLPCLTLTDKEEIEAKRETSGNFTAMQTLLDNLRRREKWPDEFIIALQNCEQRDLANKMKAIYDRIRGITNNAAPAAPTPRPAPASAASLSPSGITTSTTTVTVHAVPETTPTLLVLPPGGAPGSSTAPSNTANSEPRPAPEKPPTSVPAPSPEPVSQAEVAPPVVALSQATPPPKVSVSKVSLPVPTLTQSAKNKTPALDHSDGMALTDQTTISSSTGQVLLSTSSAQASSSDTSTSQSQITKPYTTSQTSPKSKKTQVPTADKDIKTSETIPVQDTNPPLRMERTFQEPEEMSDPTANAAVQQNNTVGLPVFNNAPTNSTTTAQATSSASAEVVMHSPSSIDEECFSKPGVLQPPEPQQNRAEIPPVFQEEPCSVVSDELEISDATDSSTELEESSIPAEQNSASFASATQSFQDPPYTAAPLNLNQPEEDHYESFYESHAQINVIQFAEEPSAENMNGQPPSILQHSRVISEDQRTLNYVGTESAVHLSEPSGHDSKKPTTINVREEESSAARSEQREEGRPELFRINNFHLIAAVGIGFSAAFLAWKFAHK